jgi:amidase
MARSARDLELLFRVIVDGSPWSMDPNCLALPYRTPTLAIKLSFAWSLGDSTLSPCPRVTLAMVRVREALERLGHEVINWTYDSPETVEDLMLSFWRADQGSEGDCCQDPTRVAT